MNLLKKWLVGDEKTAMKNGVIWNFISSMEYSLQSAILMLVITRSGGLLEAGIFTIAYTMTQMMATIGSYGMRSFQVSDVRNEYDFGTYLSSRITSVVAMILICIMYGFVQGYDAQKMILVVLLCGYRVIEDIEDVFHGEMQKSLRLDVAAKIVSIRIAIVTVVFSIVYIATKNLFLASLSLMVSAAVVSLVMNGVVSELFERITLRLQKRHMIKLLWVCLPVCLGGFLYNYLVNAPKYAIDRNLSEEMQTIFSILFMPIFAINMLSSFVFKPMIASMGIHWNNGERKQFVKMVLRQIVIIIGLTVVLVIAGALLGVQVLGFVYGVDLMEYRTLFALLIVFGGLAALAAYLVVVLTIIRKQKFIIAAYMTAVVLDWALIDLVVLRNGIVGAGFMYGLSMTAVTLVLGIVLVMTIIKERKRKDGLA